MRQQKSGSRSCTTPLVIGDGLAVVYEEGCTLAAVGQAVKLATKCQNEARHCVLAAARAAAPGPQKLCWSQGKGPWQRAMLCRTRCSELRWRRGSLQRHLLPGRVQPVHLQWHPRLRCWSWAGLQQHPLPCWWPLVRPPRPHRLAALPCAAPAAQPAPRSATGQQMVIKACLPCLRGGHVVAES